MSDILIQTRPSPKGDGHGFCIALVQVPVEGGPAAAHVVVLQDGYVTEAQALSALYECLTFAPPDMTVYDDAMAQVSGMLDRLTSIEEALETRVGPRLDALDEFKESLVPPAPAGGGLLRRKVPVPHAPPVRQAPAPSIRRPAVDTTIGMRTGRGTLDISGGAFRPGAGSPTEETEG